MLATAMKLKNYEKKHSLSLDLSTLEARQEVSALRKRKKLKENGVPLKELRMRNSKLFQLLEGVLTEVDINA